MLEDLEEIDIEPTVKSVFQRAIDSLLTEARRRDQEPDTVFGILSSELLDNPIPLRVFDLSGGYINELYNKFSVVGQSNENKGIAPLITEPFTIDITSTTKKDIEQAMQWTAHVGRGRKGRGKQAIHPNVDPTSLIWTANSDDAYCLFRAIDILRAKRDVNDPRKFYDYRKDYHRQVIDIYDIMDTMNIPRDLVGYSVEEHGFERKYTAFQKIILEI